MEDMAILILNLILNLLHLLIQNLNYNNKFIDTKTLMKLFILDLLINDLFYCYLMIKLILLFFSGVQVKSWFNNYDLDLFFSSSLRKEGKVSKINKLVLFFIWKKICPSYRSILIWKKMRQFFIILLSSWQIFSSELKLYKLRDIYIFKKKKKDFDRRPGTTRENSPGWKWSARM